MKTIKTGVLILLICLGTKNLQAQLQNSAWKGTFLTPAPTECVFEFKTDTVYLRLANDYKANGVDDGKFLEKSLYKVEHDTLTLKKLVGLSPCDSEVKGRYLFVIKNDKLSLLLIEDDCRERVVAFPPEPLTWVRD